MSLKSRLSQLEKQSAPADLIAWAELLDDGRMILRTWDGQRVDAGQGSTPHAVRVKGYQGVSPDDWNRAANE